MFIYQVAGLGGDHRAQYRRIRVCRRPAQYIFALIQTSPIHEPPPSNLSLVSTPNPIWTTVPCSSPPLHAHNPPRLHVKSVAVRVLKIC